MTSAEPATTARSHVLRGALLVLAAGLSWSFTGVFLRLAPDFGPWQFLAWRSAGTAVAILLVARMRGRGRQLARLSELGRTGAVITVAFAASSLTFIVSMKTTTVANALFLSSCAPLLAAALGFVVLRERLSLWQGGSIILGLLGILVIVSGGLETGSLVGNVCAVVTAIGFAVASVAMRFGGDRDYSPAVLGYGLTAMAVAAFVCVFAGLPLFSPIGDVVAALSAGLLPMGIGFACFLAGAPRVPAAAQTVLAQTETIFGPFWVWLAFGETPSAATLAGGAVIFAAVVSMAVATAARSSSETSVALAP